MGTGAATSLRRPREESTTDHLAAARIEPSPASLDTTLSSNSIQGIVALAEEIRDLCEAYHQKAPVEHLKSDLFDAYHQFVSLEHLTVAPDILMLPEYLRAQTVSIQLSRCCTEKICSGELNQQSIALRDKLLAEQDSIAGEIDKELLAHPGINPIGEELGEIFEQLEAGFHKLHQRFSESGIISWCQRRIGSGMLNEFDTLENCADNLTMLACKINRFKQLQKNADRIIIELAQLEKNIWHPREH
jgi:hypothetical protein